MSEEYMPLNPKSSHYGGRDSPNRGINYDYDDEEHLHHHHHRDHHHHMDQRASSVSYQPLWSSSPSSSSQSSSPLSNWMQMIRIVLLIIFCLFVIGLVVMFVLLVEHYQPRSDNDSTINLNIYLRLKKSCEKSAMDMNGQITVRDQKNHQKIDFEQEHLPHITLYLTQFDASKVELIGEAIKNVASSNFSISQQCIVDMEQAITVSGNYIMWDVKKEDCVQVFSDMIVNATSEYVSAEAKETIPDWVNSLPEDIRKKKIEMIRKYGSPGVFSEYYPHITLAWSSSNTTSLQEIVDTIEIPACTFVIDQIGLGRTGEYGTVLRGQDLIDVNVPYIAKN